MGDINQELSNEIASKTKLAQPSMAGAGVRGPVGPQKPPPALSGGPKPHVVGNSPPDIEVAEGGSRMAQLDPRTVLRVELLSTRKKLAEADERMGLWTVQDARRRKQELDKEEATLMAEVSRQLDVPVGSCIRLIDKERGLCKVE